MFTEEVAERAQEREVAAAGFTVAGRHEVPYPDDARLGRRVFWLDGDGARVRR